MHAEIRSDVNGVMVSGDVLLIGPETKVQQARAQALLHHEVGTHLVTQANGSHQPIKVLGVGLAGYDETQEGLAVLAEIACGGLDRLPPAPARQPRRRPCTASSAGATFAEAHEALVADDFPSGSALTTVMRVYRSGGMTKDAIYLRGLVELLEHLGAGGVARPALARQVLAARPAAHRRPRVPRPAAAAARPAPIPARPGRRTTTSPARPAPKISAHSWRDTHEDRIRRQRHRDREGGVHHQPPRPGRQGDGARGLVHGHRRLRLRARRLAEHQGPRRATPSRYRSLERHMDDVQKPDVEQLDRRWTSSTW